MGPHKRPASLRVTCEDGQTLRVNVEKGWPVLTYESQEECL